MKKAITFLILINILILSGCSHTKGIANNPTISPKPVERISPRPVESIMPSSTTSPTVTIAASISITSIPTSIPSPAQTSVTKEAIPTDRNFETLKGLLNKMTLEEKIGQMFFVRCNKKTAMADIKKYHFGGFILFKENFKDQTREKVKNVIHSYQNISHIPMLMGVDEEGGIVNRISISKEFRAVPFKSPQELFQLGGYDLIQSDTLEKAKLLKSLGINVNLAPICDVSTNSKDFIFKRTFGKDANATSKYVKTVVSVMNKEKIGCTLKHFPGYGNNIDTHNGIAIDTRNSSHFYKIDFLPFKAGIEASTGSILVSHNIVKSFDAKNPASLSAKVHQLLRNELNYNGIIMTDDLSMDAIKKYTGEKTAAVLAVKAGNDLLIASDYEIQIPAVINAVKNKTISEKQIDASVLRILSWKLSLEIIKLKTK